MMSWSMTSPLVNGASKFAVVLLPKPGAPDICKMNGLWVAASLVQLHHPSWLPYSQARLDMKFVVKALAKIKTRWRQWH
jgi:hypothetical protein